MSHRPRRSQPGGSSALCAHQKSRRIPALWQHSSVYSTAKRSPCQASSTECVRSRSSRLLKSQRVTARQSIFPDSATESSLHELLQLLPGHKNYVVVLQGLLELGAVHDVKIALAPGGSPAL